MRKKEKQTSITENQQQQQADKARLFINQYARFTGMAFEMLAAIVGGALLGMWLDKKYDTSAVWTVVLSLVGIAIGLYVVFKDIDRINRKKTNKR